MMFFLYALNQHIEKGYPWALVCLGVMIDIKMMKLVAGI